MWYQAAMAQSVVETKFVHTYIVCRDRYDSNTLCVSDQCIIMIQAGNSSFSRRVGKLEGKLRLTKSTFIALEYSKNASDSYM